MNIGDIVSRNEGKNTFAIIGLDVFEETTIVTLVEVYPDNNAEHVDPNAETLRITVRELKAFYTKVC